MITLKVGDRFFTIAYTRNTRVIEVEVIETKDIDGTNHIHFQNVEYIIDRWFLPCDFVEQWKFNTREETELKLKEIAI